MHWLGADEALIEFTAPVARLRRQHPTFHRRRFLDGRPVFRGAGEPLPDIVWMTPGVDAMAPEDWSAGFGRSIGVLLDGNGIRGGDARGARVVDDLQALAAVEERPTPGSPQPRCPTVAPVPVPLRPEHPRPDEHPPVAAETPRRRNKG